MQTLDPHPHPHPYTFSENHYTENNKSFIFMLILQSSCSNWLVKYSSSHCTNINIFMAALVHLKKSSGKSMKNRDTNNNHVTRKIS